MPRRGLPALSYARGDERLRGRSITESRVNNIQDANPGDSFDPKLLTWKGIETLILPIMAPFLTEVEAVAFARRMEPKQVLPVHDGYAKDFFVKGRQEAYEGALKNLGIGFHRLTEVGAGVEV